MDTNLLNTLAIALIPYAAAAISTGFLWIVKEGVALIKAKKGNESYIAIRNNAVDTWHEIEEIYKSNPKLKTEVDSKLNTFAASLRAKVPGISDENITALSKALNHELSKDKPLIAATIYDSPITADPTEGTVNAQVAVQAVQQTVQQVVATVKYFAPDGTELVPATPAVNNTTAQ